jgi:hypothetical protein
VAIQQFIELTVGLLHRDAALPLDFTGAPITPARIYHQRIANQTALLFHDLPAELPADAVTTIAVHVGAILVATTFSQRANYPLP